MVFSTQFDARDRIISNAGSRIKQLYEARVDNQGHIDLVESGTEDLYDYIQSFKESCDINTIVKRFAAGDTDVLARRQATYGDFTELPRTYAELLNTVIQGENYFNSLPFEMPKLFFTFCVRIHSLIKLLTMEILIKLFVMRWKCRVLFFCLSATILSSRTI